MGDELGSCNKGTILTDTSDQEHLHECSHFFLLLAHPFCEIRDREVFRITLLEVSQPSGLILLNQVGEFFEVGNRRFSERMLGEGNDVEPCVFFDEVELISLWLLSDGFDIFSSTCLQESSHIIACDFLSSYQDLEADHQHEGDLVLLEETSVDVPMDVLGHGFDDEVNPFLRRVSFGGFLSQRPVKQL